MRPCDLGEVAGAPGTNDDHAQGDGPAGRARTMVHHASPPTHLTGHSVTSWGAVNRGTARGARGGAYRPEGGRARGLVGGGELVAEEGPLGEEVRPSSIEGEGRSFKGSGSLLDEVARLRRRWRRRRSSRSRSTLRHVSTTRTMATHHAL